MDKNLIIGSVLMIGGFVSFVIGIKIQEYRYNKEVERIMKMKEELDKIGFKIL